MTLGEARDRHLAARKILAGGNDPMVERKATAEAKQKEIEARERESGNSFENVARKWWNWWAPGKSERHTDYVLRRLEADVFPSFAYKFIDAVTAADIRTLMVVIEGPWRKGRCKTRTRDIRAGLPLCDCSRDCEPQPAPPFR